jgi:hypothetical protein
LTIVALPIVLRKKKTFTLRHVMNTQNNTCIPRQKCDRETGDGITMMKEARIAPPNQPTETPAMCHIFIDAKGRRNGTAACSKKWAPLR